MNLSTLTPAKGSVKKRKRIARGQGSGHGGTSTKGHKGAQSRSGYKKRAGFEGGQTPLQRRIPKFGFKNINRVEFEVMNLTKLQEVIEKNKLETIDFEILRKLKLVSQFDKIKILGNGTLTAKASVKAHAFSETAKKAIEANGGTAEIIA